MPQLWQSRHFSIASQVARRNCLLFESKCKFPPLLVWISNAFCPNFDLGNIFPVSIADDCCGWVTDISAERLYVSAKFEIDSRSIKEDLKTK